MQYIEKNTEPKASLKMQEDNEEDHHGTQVAQVNNPASTRFTELGAADFLLSQKKKKTKITKRPPTPKVLDGNYYYPRRLKTGPVLSGGGSQTFIKKNLLTANKPK